MKISVTVAAVVCGALVVALSGVSLQAHNLRAKLAALEQERAAPVKPVLAGKTSGHKEQLLQQLLDEQRAAYAKLQQQYAALDQRRDEVAAPPPAPPSVTTTNAAGDSGRGSWLERLKTEDPARYKQITEERDKRRQAMDSMFQEQQARLDQRMQNARTQQEADLVGQIEQTVAKLDQLRQSWQQIRELPEDQRHEQAQLLASESMQAYQQLVDLRQKDRQLQLQQLAADVGYADKTTANQFVDAIQRIYKETDTSPMRMMGGGRGSGGGGGR